MPEPVQFGLAILEPIKVPSKLLETVRELAHKVAGPCQKWWEEPGFDSPHRSPRARPPSGTHPEPAEGRLGAAPTDLGILKVW